MPSNLLDDFLQGIDPIDVSTLFATLRGSVPLGMAFRSGETNVNNDEELARRRGPRFEQAPRPLSPDEVYRRAMLDFESQYPDPNIRQLLIDAMLRERRDPYSPTTATRRRDFEEAPATAQHSMQAAPRPRRYANGGAIDFTSPDMADGGRFIPTAQPFNKGGSAKKTLDEMAAELAKKSVRVADEPDLARRGFFGFGSNPAFPLANLDIKALEKMQSEFKGAPAITEKTVTVDPGKGAAKSTLKSLSETPVSRREVLKTAAGQALRGALPDLGGLSSLGNVAKAAESAAAPTAMPSSMIAPLLAQAAEQGMKLKDALAFVRSKVPGADELFELEETFRNYKNPSRMDYEDDLLSPSDVMRDLLAAQDKSSIMAARPEMRAMKSMAPKKYEQLKDASRDFSMQSIENALERGVLRGDDEVDMFLRGDPKIWDIMGKR